MEQTTHFEVFKMLLQRLIDQHPTESATTTKFLRGVITNAHALRVAFTNAVGNTELTITIIASQGSVVSQTPVRIDQRWWYPFTTSIADAMSDFTFHTDEDAGPLTFDQLLHLNPWFTVRPVDLTYCHEGICLGTHMTGSDFKARRMITVKPIPKQDE
jgi:hypothetical protein